MIDFKELKNIYEKELGFPLFFEEGEAVGFYRERNNIVQPICGIFHVNPTPITAIRAPFFAVTSVDISVLAPPDRWEDVRNTMDEVAANLNGTSFEMRVEEEADVYKTYSIAYNCQTSNVADHIRDVALGVGEVFYIHQTISYIIAEGGVSAYDTRLWIDGKEVPFLTIVENRIHTTSVYPSNNGTAQTASEMETYGIDFTAPYTNEVLFESLRKELNEGSKNKAHCVIIEKNRKKSCKIMQVSNISNTIQPPQYIGFNVSLTEVAPLSAEFDGTWAFKNITKQFAALHLYEMLDEDPELINVTVFWGDGTADHFEVMNGSCYHLYEDGAASHTVIIKKELATNLVSIARANTNLFGCEIVFDEDLTADSVYRGVLLWNTLEGEDMRAIGVLNGSFVQMIGTAVIPFADGNKIPKGYRAQCCVDYPIQRDAFADEHIKVDRLYLEPFIMQEE